ncbi:hypothetical protein BKA93DRAFT_810481 [Sparassis latifolia]
MAERDDASLADRLVPSRAAGRKASKLTAEQLNSSPISDRDSTFGEPTRGKGGVKITYGGKGKRNSPKKAPRHPSPMPVAPARSRKASMNAARDRPSLLASIRLDTPSHMSVSGSSLTPFTDSEQESASLSKDGGIQALHEKTSTAALPSGSASKPSIRKRRTTISENHSGPMTRSRVGPSAHPPRNRSPSVSYTDRSLSPSAPSLFTQAQKKSPRKEERSTRTTRASLFKADTSGPSTRADKSSVRDVYTSRKRARSGSSSARSLFPTEPSVLTPLSSPPPTDPSAHRRSRSRPSSLLRRGSVISINSSPEAAPPPSSQMQPLTLSHARYQHMDELEMWTLADLGSLVFVRLNTEGDVVEQDDDDIETIWWPAKVTHARIPLRLSLFGDSPNSTDDVRIFVPSPSNVLSMTFGGVLRFNEGNFRRSARLGSPLASPRKKQKTDLENRWIAGRELMLKTDEDDNDGLPMMLSAYTGNGASPHTRDGSPAVSVFGESDAELAEKSWRAPSCDPMYTLPGEPALAKEMRHHTVYWPAQLLEYITPTKRTQKPRYKVQFYDGMIKNLDTSQFFTEGDQGFETCQLGEDKYNYGMDDDQASSDAGADDSDMNANEEADLRVASPPPTIPAPEEFAYRLLLEEQLRYVKPVLLAVMDGKYEPANDRHDGFMRGAAARQKVCDTCHDRGSLSQREVEELDKLVRRWVRRRERREELDISADGGEPSSTVASSPGDHGAGAENVNMQADGNHEVNTKFDGRSSSASAAVADVLVPPDGPPSSFVSPEEGPEQQRSNSMSPSGASEKHMENEHGSAEADPRPPEPVHSPSVVDLTPDFEMDEEVPSNPTGTDGPSDDIPRSRPTTTFMDLSSIEKITYCTNVLLHEAVLQLLLWRSGERMAPDLLSPEEEIRLHAIALTQSQETNWVHDIVRMKQAIGGNMLSFKGKSRTTTSQPASSSRGGGTRSRPRKA